MKTFTLTLTVTAALIAAAVVILVPTPVTFACLLVASWTAQATFRRYINAEV